MDDHEIRRRLEPLASFRTLDNRVLNEVRHVGVTSITVFSEQSRTGEERVITYDHIRRAVAGGTEHGSACRALARILGLF
ncbi:MAG: hypothetical protein H6734_27360 [Alphaproteobacteria bacterium]|nr:hypothetical protein [Alphaproteobacteria bacterium]